VTGVQTCALPISTSQSTITPSNSGKGTPRSRASLFGAIFGSLAALAAIAGILVFFVRRKKGDEDDDDDSDEDGEDTAELEEWKDFTPSHLCMTELMECENILDPEAQLDTFANTIFDESNLAPFMSFT
jgi:hypothetical protein